jgi:DNA-binding response OmpR family regulator
MSTTKPIKVILAEDEEIISTVYKLGLTHHGYEVTVAHDGLEAMEYLKKDTPDILLLDIIMPNMNGFEVLEALNKDRKFKGLPIIVLSNLSQSTDEQKALDLGASDYLIKADYSLKELVACIEKVLLAS